MRMGFGKFPVISILQGLLFAGAAVADADAEDHVERSFHVAPGGRLTIDADRGSIEVRTADRELVDVKIERKVRRNGKWSVEELLEDFTITFDQRDDGITIRAKYDKKDLRRWSRERNRLRVKFLITVPQRYNVDLKTSGGGISVADLEGEVRSQTAGGGLRIGRIRGPVWGRTAGGSIELEGAVGNTDLKTSGGGIGIGRVEGAVEAKTAGGSIRIDKATGSVNAKTSGGNITVEEVMGDINAKTLGGSVKAYISGQPEGDCSLSTSGGSVTAYLDGDIAMNVDARTTGGRVSTDVPITTVVQGKLRKNRLQGAINGGGPLLKLHTFGGSIHLHKKSSVESQHGKEETR